MNASPYQGMKLQQQQIHFSYFELQQARIHSNHFSFEYLTKNNRYTFYFALKALNIPATAQTSLRVLTRALISASEALTAS